ncbi:hypothetical protein ACERK3_10775 [Phycisphaerales bacterium AB-hyl4]|uniref:Uncharacterized protein n=1 Tax=Natronomicrosphaera hydrolytica TaxID=3242702 RepID=A0ABV4U6I6_9BACT
MQRILKRAKVSRWTPAFQVLRACAEVDFLQLGLSERLYTRAIGHSPEVSRKYYLDKFEKTVLEDQERNEYLAALKIAESRIVKAAG